MIVFPNCKINLGLHILRKRADGFHDLETIFYPLSLHDALEIVTAEPGEEVSLTTSGLAIDAAGDNLCTTAYHLLKNDFPQLPNIKMHLHKTIPIGAGLGGGSADGAFTLLLLNKKYNLQLTPERLLAYAAQLGSDCPFFIINQPCFGTGRGEVLTPFPLDLSPYKIIIVNPAIPIPTGWAFGQLQHQEPPLSLKEVAQQQVEEWKDVMVNDFETPVFRHYPAVKECKDELYRKGAVYAAMSGTGSTVFGLFNKEAAPTFSFPANYFVKEC